MFLEFKKENVIDKGFPFLFLKNLIFNQERNDGDQGFSVLFLKSF